MREHGKPGTEVVGATRVFMLKKRDVVRATNA
jgi:hypothetical protein